MLLSKSGQTSLSAASFQAVIEKNSTVGMFCVAGREILYVNPAFRNFFRIDENLSVDQIDLTRLFVNADLIAGLTASLQPSSPVAIETVLCQKTDGSRFWCSLNFTRIENGGNVFFSGSLVDCTIQISNELLLRKNNEDLKKLNLQLDRFLYSASHDVRQPLTSMMGLIRLMRMERIGETEADYLGKLQTSVTKLDEFLRQIMEFSQNSHERVTSELIAIETLLKECVAKYQRQLDKKKITVTVLINGDNVFYSDSRRIAVAVEHLLKNCVDYSDTTKPDPFVRVIATCYEDRTVIEVIDNGIGISKAHLHKVTEMFYRATDRSKGSGIGLYIVNEVVLRLQGSLSIDSEMALGTMVRIELPNGVKGILINRKKHLRDGPRSSDHTMIK